MYDVGQVVVIYMLCSQGRVLAEYLFVLDGAWHPHYFIPEHSMQMSQNKAHFIRRVDQTQIARRGLESCGRRMLLLDWCDEALEA